MKTRQKQLMWRWSVLSSSLIALFWTIYYFTTGSVPIVTSIDLTPTTTIDLPFTISRWWDILIGPIYTIIFVSIFNANTMKRDEDFNTALVVGLIIGLGVGLVVGLGFGLGVSLGFGLVVGLVAGLLKILFRQPLWTGIWNWLMAR